MSGIDELLQRLRESPEPIDPVELYATLDNEYRNIQTLHSAEVKGYADKVKEAEEKAREEAAEKSRIQGLLVERLMNTPVEPEEGNKAGNSGDDEKPKTNSQQGIMSLFKKVEK